MYNNNFKIKFLSHIIYIIYIVNMKCSCCGTSVAIIKCKECSSNMCYNCDERVHIKFERHSRSTLSF